MALDEEKIAGYGDALYHALRQRTPIAPLTDTEPGITIEDAYHISRHFLELRVADGATVVGKKIGVTSKAVQDMLEVYQPDFGYLTDDMVVASGAELQVTDAMIQPKAEGEIAFLLKHDLAGPGLSNADVIRATEGVMACIEVVDSRISDWKIRIQDTVADNASCGSFVLGEQLVDLRDVDVVTAGMVMEMNGELVATGAGAAALGSPVNCVTWLGNTLGAFGIPLRAGEVILSGSLVPLRDVAAGDTVSCSVGGIGGVSVRFT